MQRVSVVELRRAFLVVISLMNDEIRRTDERLAERFQ